MTEHRHKKASVVLAVWVAILAVAVVVQSFFLHRLYQSTQREQPTPQPAASLVAKTTPSALQLNSTARTPRQLSVSVDPWGSDPAWSGWGAGSWEPFAEMQQMRQHMNRLFEDSFNRFRVSPGFTHQWDDLSFSPELDLTDDGKNYIVRFDIPGVEKPNIDVQIADRTLTVSGETSEEVEEKDGGQVIRLERRSGQFQRAMTLPGPVDSAQMTAEYEDGVLTITVPKKEPEKESKTIKVS